MNRHINLPPTKEGAKLLAELEKSGNEIPEVVYEKTEDGGGYVFKCAFDDEVDYGDDCIIVPVTSTYKGTDTWDGGQKFANVLGSKGDKGRYDGRLITWENLYNIKHLPWERYENPEYYDCFDGTVLTGAKFACDGTHIYGGHVIKGSEPKSLDPDNDVYIVPICSRHNSVNAPHITPRPTPGNGNGFYMTLRGNATDKKDVIEMQGYLKMQAIEEYIK